VVVDDREGEESLHIPVVPPRWRNASDGATSLEGLMVGTPGAIIATAGRAEAYAVSAYLGDCGITGVGNNAILANGSTTDSTDRSSTDSSSSSVVVTWLVAGGTQALSEFFAKQQALLTTSLLSGRSGVGGTQGKVLLVHLVRHPLRSIEGTLNGEGSAFWEVAMAHLKGKEYAKPNKLMKSIRYWLDWNRAAERHASVRLRVEDIHQGPSKLLRYLTTAAPDNSKNRALEQKKQKTRRRHRSLLGSPDTLSSPSSAPLGSFPECPARALSAGLLPQGGEIGDEKGPANKAAAAGLLGGARVGSASSEAQQSLPHEPPQPGQQPHTELTWTAVQKACGLRVFRELAVAAVKYGYGDDLPNKGAGGKIELAKKKDRQATGN